MRNLFGVNKIIAVTTAAVRNADNGEEFLRHSHHQTNITPRAISGDEEALQAGVANTLDTRDALIFSTSAEAVPN